jgi:hypothetical protein
LQYRASLIVGIIKSHIFENIPPKTIPETSLYFPTKERLMTPVGNFISASEFAENVFARLTKPNLPPVFCVGSMTWPPKIVNFLVFLFGPRVWDSVTGERIKPFGQAKTVGSRELKKLYSSAVVNGLSE